MNGVVEYHEVVPPRTLGHGYQVHDFSFLATGPTTVQFDFRHDAGFFTLDDVAIGVGIARIPEPATLTLTLFGVGLVGIRLLRVRHQTT